MSESEDYEYYAYSSDEDGYPLDESQHNPTSAAGGGGTMDWEAASEENPNAAPMNFNVKRTLSDFDSVLRC